MIKLRIKSIALGSSSAMTQFTFSTIGQCLNLKFRSIGKQNLNAERIGLVGNRYPVVPGIIQVEQLLNRCQPDGRGFVFWRWVHLFIPAVESEAFGTAIYFDARRVVGVVLLCIAK